MIKDDEMLNTAKQVVVDYFNQHLCSSTRYNLTCDDVFVVWFCKTLQNWKALVSYAIPDGRYYEVTYNGDKDEIYLDVYEKKKNLCIKAK